MINMSTQIPQQCTKIHVWCWPLIVVWLLVWCFAIYRAPLHEAQQQFRVIPVMYLDIIDHKFAMILISGFLADNRSEVLWYENSTPLCTSNGTFFFRRGYQSVDFGTIAHCLGLGHETMVCAVCLSIFLTGDWSHCLGRPDLSLLYEVLPHTA